jgi:hypothetical protein
LAVCVFLLICLVVQKSSHRVAVAISVAIVVVLIDIITPKPAFDPAQSQDRTLSSTPPKSTTIYSFPFIMGAPLGDNDSPEWMMVVRTYGPPSTYNCNVKFTDLAGGPTHFLHVNTIPGPNLGFAWKPVDLNQQHYVVEISCPDIAYKEDWEVGRVQGLLRTRITLTKVFLWDAPEPIYSCTDRVSSYSTDPVKLQDKYTTVNPDWKPNHTFEFPTIIIPSRNNPGQFAYSVTVKNPGCWECLQWQCGIK